MLKRLPAAALIIALSLAAYMNSLHAEFELDDYHQIVNNSRVRDLANIPRFFVDASLGTSDLSAKGYRPVTYASFAVNYALGGNSVVGYHIFNLALHVTNALLVFLLLGMLLKDERGLSGYVPALASLLFALHPIQTGAVTYISGRGVLLAALFSLSSFCCFILYRRTAHTATAVAAAVAAPILFILGLMSKEMAAGTLGLMVMYDLLLDPRGGRGALKRALYYVPFVALIACYILERRFLTGYAVSSPPYTVGVYLMSQAEAFLIYLRLMLLPFNQNMDYSMPVTASINAKVAVSLCVIAAGVYFIVKARRKHPEAAFFGAWFLVTLAPESSVFPIRDIIEEYRLYLPSVGLLALLAIIAVRAVDERRRVARVAAVAVVLLLLSVLTMTRNSVWATESTLWNDVIRKSPRSPGAHSEIAKAYFSEGRYEDSIRELETVVGLDPSPTLVEDAYNNLGVLHLTLGRFDKARFYFGEVIKLNPGLVEAYAGLGEALNAQGRYEESEEALKRGIKVAPSADLLHKELGETYQKLGRKADALAQMQQAAALAPKDYATRFSLAVMYSENRLVQQALNEANEALSLAATKQDAEEASSLIRKLNGQ